MSFKSANLKKAMIIDSHLRIGSPDDFVDYKIVDDIRIQIIDDDACIVESKGNLYIDYLSEVPGVSAKGVKGFLLVDGKFVIDDGIDILGREKKYSICHFDLEVLIEDEDCYLDITKEEIGLLREPIESFEESSEDEEIL